MRVTDEHRSIIFVHGLQGHPQRTWTFARKTDKTKKRHLFSRRKEEPESAGGSVYWPSDLLAQEPELAGARILTWGYDSHVTKFFDANNKQNISMHGNDLMVALEQQRRRNPTRPMIFIAHSLGGILVKVALEDSTRAHHREIYSQLLKSTRGIVFLGTPHSGSNVAAMGIAASNFIRLGLQDSNQKVLQGLVYNNELLYRLNASFLDIVQQGSFRVHSFYETKSMTGVYGINDMVVPFESAILGDKSHETVRGINANHHEICKFSSKKDKGYRDVCGAIIDCLAEARKHRTHGLYQSRADDTDLQSITVHESIYESRIDQDPALHLYVEEIKHDIEYKTVSDGTETSIEPPIADRNLDWLFESPEFREWELGSSSSMLWLGSKTPDENTYAAGRILQRVFNRRYNAFHVLGAANYLPSEGKSLALEALEIVKKLLRQIIDQDVNRIYAVMDTHPLSRIRKPRPFIFSPTEWKLRQLLDLLYSALATGTTTTCVVINGIEPMNSHTYAFISQLLGLLKDQTANPTIAPVKIIFATSPRAFPNPMSEQDRELATIPYIEKGQELKDCLTSLHTSDFDARPSAISDANETTFEWLWKDGIFNDWVQDTSSSLLLIQGKPGSGKSTLAKRILGGIPHPFEMHSPRVMSDYDTDSTYSSSSDSEESHHSDVSRKTVMAPRTIMAHFFYSFRGGNIETSHEEMLRSILYQLLKQEPSFYALFRDHFRKMRRTSSTALWTFPILLSILESLSCTDQALRVYIVLDAMDESDSHELPQILQAMANLCTSAGESSFKGLMTTRPLNSALKVKRLEAYTPLVFALEAKNQEAINQMVDMTIGNIIEDIVQEDPSVDLSPFHDIKQYIKSHADGVFLWVGKVLTEVKVWSDRGWTQDNLDDLKTMLPTELMALYKRITQRIVEQKSSSDIALGKKILALAAFSSRPLTIEEMRDAIIVPSEIELEEFKLHPNCFKSRINLLERTIPRVCGDLVETKKRTVQLVHETVREFLLHKDHIADPFDMDWTKSTISMAYVCVRYLELSLSKLTLEHAGVKALPITSWEDDDYQAFARHLESRPFFHYTVTHLQQYLGRTGNASILGDLRVALLDMMEVDATRYFLVETDLPILAGVPIDHAEVKLARDFRGRVLITAARLGHGRAIEPLMLCRTDINFIDPVSNQFPLLVATISGQKDVIRRLIELQVGLDTMDEDGETSLYKAIILGHHDIAKLLIEAGAYTAFRSLSRETPLHLAAVRGYLDIVEFILERYEYRARDRDQFGETALHGAVSHGHIAIAETLIRYNANVNANVSWQGTPLHIAVDRRDMQMVKLLLSLHADVDMTGSYGATAIHSAAARGDEDMVALLLDHKAETSIKDRHGWRPLDWALRNGHDRVAQLLMHHGAARSDSPEPVIGWDETDRLPVLGLRHLFM
ncbi:hypothetical protein PFICI_07420 [Pestalotiopsis fici W106-1]|uniref:Uncharacterized protein n=1 Tax=Pestalotiopsis fici (strain W106-1 / CGMCC3.15140) TaxID=1229662 RepID=W3X3Z6_PESFW|nr:uncharacterized protein PFICI_07420 [Pestalotiopsis fici W106-1]ETS79891.1 hypothetical protein PFICI_07420 [Pestalotiopsis fici W106-1]